MKPGPLLTALSLAWLLLGMAGFFLDTVSLVWLLTGLFLLPLVIIDSLVLFFLVDRLNLKREISSSLAQGESTKVKIKISRDDKKFLPARILLWDLHPSSMQTEAFPAILKPNSVMFEYTLKPLERGLWFFHGLELLLSSPFRLWQLKVFHPCESQVRTYPNFKRIKDSADLKGLFEKSGLKNIRMRGHGLDFRSLREYQEGDSIRAVDWRATSRKRKVIIREYQEERDQQLLFLLDSGYRLHRWDQGPDEQERWQFDSALEAALLLSWISLKHGDSVGVGSFGTKRWLSPRKGIATFPLLMNNLYDLYSSPSPSSPLAALEEAMSRLKRRTFIILISNLREEDGLSLSWILKRMEKRHLLLLVSLREKESETLALRQPKGSDEALETAAAFSYLVSRRNLYKSWEHSGILTMETSAEDLSGALINRYLEVKRSGRL